MDRGPRPDNRSLTSEPRSAEPWSEVPPELEQLLRAELARKAPVSEPQPRTEAPALEIRATEAPAEEVAKPKPRATRTRTAKIAPAASSMGEASAPESSTEVPAKTSAAKTRTTRARTTKAAPAAEAAVGGEATAEPKKPATRRRKAAPVEEG